MVDCCSVTTLGYLAIGFILFKIYKPLRSIFYTHILAKRLGHLVNIADYGKWAVVTGSTDGIGKGYAKELAKRGMNIFLISRNQTRLDNTEKEIKTMFKNVEVRTFASDFASATLQSFDSLSNALVGLEIGVLVNNVGMVNDPEYFLQTPGNGQFWKDMLNVNCFTATQLTALILPKMKERRKGVIINICSDSGFVPTPLYSVYSGTKAFLQFFTRGLQVEYSDSGVILQVVYPYYVATKAVGMDKNNATFFAPNPDYYAESALNTVGIENQTFGCLSHAIQHAFYQIFPESWFLAYMKKMILSEREKFLAQAAKKQ